MFSYIDPIRSDALNALPKRVGVGLKPEHFKDILSSQPDIGFFEVHAENYMGAGGALHHYLGRIRADYPLSIHGVGLSIGGEDRLDPMHLMRLKTLLDRYQPQSFSEHLAWSSHSGTFFNDLLPLPYTRATLERVCRHVDQIQEVLQTRILLENPSTYLEFVASEMQEAEFLCAIVERTGCGLLLDVNNLYVSGVNHGWNPKAMLEALPLHAVGEIHIAGHTVDADANVMPLMIDSHGAPVADAVWELYGLALGFTGQQATLLERDSDLPPFRVLLAEAQGAENYLRSIPNQEKDQQRAGSL